MAEHRPKTFVERVQQDDHAYVFENEVPMRLDMIVAQGAVPLGAVVHTATDKAEFWLSGWWIFGNLVEPYCGAWWDHFILTEGPAEAISISKELYRLYEHHPFVAFDTMSPEERQQYDLLVADGLHPGHPTPPLGKPGSENVP